MQGEAEPVQTGTEQYLTYCVFLRGYFPRPFTGAIGGTGWAHLQPMGAMMMTLHIYDNPIYSIQQTSTGMCPTPQTPQIWTVN